jgi:hypothetical protein
MCHGVIHPGGAEPDSCLDREEVALSPVIQCRNDFRRPYLGEEIVECQGQIPSSTSIMLVLPVRMI